MEAWKATVLLMVTLVLPKATVLLMVTLVLPKAKAADGEEVPDHVAEGEGADQPLRMESDGSPR